MKNKTSKDKISLWLEAHPFLDRLADAIIGAIIGAILPKIYSIIAEADKAKDVVTNYEFWLMICIFIIAVVALNIFVKFQTRGNHLEEEKESAKIQMINKLTSEILGEDDFNETLKKSSEVTTFIEQL